MYVHKIIKIAIKMKLYIIIIKNNGMQKKYSKPRYKQISNIHEIILKIEKLLKFSKYTAKKRGKYECMTYRQDYSI